MSISEPNARPPEAVATSQEIRDRGSIFTGTLFHASSPSAAEAAVQQLRHVIHGSSTAIDGTTSKSPSSKPATHYISAFRCMVLKQGRTGLGGPDDFEMKEGSSDDGEQGAGSKVLKVMREEAVIDAVVIVCRWYGGILLGPVRFTHVETCAREVCRTFRRKEEVEECVSALRTLDDLLSTLRAELRQISADPAASSTSVAALPSSPPVDTAAAAKTTHLIYDSLLGSLDVSRARKLVTARERAVKIVKSALAKRKSQTST